MRNAKGYACIIDLTARAQSTAPWEREDTGQRKGRRGGDGGEDPGWGKFNKLGKKISGQEV